MKIPSIQAHRKTRIEIIPLIDIMFFLLASFMMVSLQMQKVQTLRANLPTATQPRKDSKPPEMVSVAVDQFGKLSVDKQSITYAEFKILLTNKLAELPETPVFISGHKETKHSAMIFVLDQARSAGAIKVAFSVRPEKSSASPTQP